MLTYAMELPPCETPCERTSLSLLSMLIILLDVLLLTAMDEVMRNTPPSGLARKVGRAARKRASLPLTLTAQHCKSMVSGHGRAMVVVRVTLSQSSSPSASRSPKSVVNFVYPYLNKLS